MGNHLPGPPYNFIGWKESLFGKLKNGSKWHRDFYEALGTSNHRRVNRTFFSPSLKLEASPVVS